MQHGFHCRLSLLVWRCFHLAALKPWSRCVLPEFAEIFRFTKRDSERVQTKLQLHDFVPNAM